MIGLSCAGCAEDSSPGRSSGGSSSGGADASGEPLDNVTDLGAIGANATVGLEWTAVRGAESYDVYWSASPRVTPETGNRLSVASPNLVHRSLDNGATYYYRVRAVRGGEQSTPSPEVSAVPGGEWALEEYGNGLVMDVRGEQLAPRIELAKRIHVLLFAEGYTEADLSILHDVESHEGSRENDVDRWLDLVFGIEPYAALRQAFVVWYLPRSSISHIGAGNTAFQVPIDFSGSSPAMGSVQPMGETARLAWEAIAQFPYAATDFSGGGFGSSRSNVAAFLIFDPERRRAGVNGLALALQNPTDTGQRIGTGFGVGPAHEFGHALSGLRDEYLEDDNMPPPSWTEKSNVAGTWQCAEVPWRHLLAGGDINPAQPDLVGAFGRERHGYHSELLCLMNGVHDNALYYGGDGLLRVDDRMCNFCREVTALSIYQRASMLDATLAGVETWKNEYRAGYYQQFPFVVPDLVPQTNDVNDPSAGSAVYEPCSAVSAAGRELAAPEGAPEAMRAAQPSTAAAPRRRGCVIEDLPPAP